MALSRISTGYDELDKLLGGGITKAQLAVIAGGMGVGKFSLALCIGLNAALWRGAKVGIASLRMPQGDVLERLLSSKSGVEVKQLRSEILPEFSKMMLDMAKDSVRSSDIWINDQHDLTISELFAMVEARHRVAPLDILIVDRVQSLSMQVQGPVVAPDLAMLALREMSRNLQVSVIADYRLDYESSGGDSIISAWEAFNQDTAISLSDMSMFMHRKDLEYAERAVLERELLSIYPKGVTKVAVKRRGIARVGECDLMFLGQIGRFEPMAKSA